MERDFLEAWNQKTLPMFADGLCVLRYAFSTPAFKVSQWWALRTLLGLSQTCAQAWTRVWPFRFLGQRISKPFFPKVSYPQPFLSSFSFVLCPNCCHCLWQQWLLNIYLYIFLTNTVHIFDRHLQKITSAVGEFQIKWYKGKPFEAVFHGNTEQINYN